MSRNGEWVDQIFVQSTAWYLNHDILVMTPTNTKQDPYFKISGNLYEESIPCPGYALTLGCKTDSHYQSFLPENGRLENARSKKNDRAIYLPKTSDPEAQSKIYEERNGQHYLKVIELKIKRHKMRSIFRLSKMGASVLWHPSKLNTVNP